MKKFLRKIHLIDCLITELPTTRQQFVYELSSITDRGSTGLFSEPFESLRSSNYEFKGYVSEEGFSIRKRRKFFDRGTSTAIATGSFTEEGETLLIETEVNGFHRFYAMIYLILFIFYSLMLLAISTSNSNNGILGFLFLILHATFMFGLPYFIMRRSVRRLKYDLEREFYYLTKQ